MIPIDIICLNFRQRPRSFAEQPEEAEEQGQTVDFFRDELKEGQNQHGVGADIGLTGT